MVSRAFAAFCGLALLREAYAGTGEVLSLSGDSLTRAVALRDEALFVAAMPPEEQCGEHCFKVREALAEFAAKKGDVATVATVPGTSGVVGPEGEVMPLFDLVNVTEAPLLLIYPYGRKDVASPMRLDAQTTVGLAHAGAKRLAKAMLQLLPNPVQTVTQHSFERFFKEKDPDAHRLLVFSRRPAVSPLVKRLCLDFDRRVVCGQVAVPENAAEEGKGSIARAAADLASRFGVTEYPTVLVSPAPGHVLDVGEKEYAWKQFEGAAASLPALASWLDAAVPRVPVPHVRSRSEWETHCTAHGGICVLFVLDAKGGREQLQVANAVAARSLLTSSTSAGGQMDTTRYPVSFVKLRDADQPELVSALRAGPTPSAVVINMRKQRFATHDGPFNAEALSAFVFNAVRGKVDLDSFDSFPALRTVKAQPKSKGKSKGRGKGGGKGKTEEAKDEL